MKCGGKRQNSQDELQHAVKGMMLEKTINTDQRSATEPTTSYVTLMATQSDYDGIPMETQPYPYSSMECISPLLYVQDVHSSQL